MQAVRQSAGGQALRLCVLGVLAGLSCQPAGWGGSAGGRSSGGPVLTRITPERAVSLGGGVVSIYGENFQPEITVRIAGQSATEVTVWSGSLVTARVPRNLGALGRVAVAVTNPDGQTKERRDLFSYYASQFAFPTQFLPGPAGITAMAVGDLNGDTLDDLALGLGAAQQVTLLLSNGEGGHIPSLNYVVEHSPTALALGDFNQDGKQDVVTLGGGSNKLNLLLGDGQGRLVRSTHTLSDAAGGLAAGDVNGDGRQDLVVLHSVSQRLSLLLGDGQGGFSARSLSLSGRSPSALAIADLNGDQRQDIAVCNGGDGTVSVLLGDGTGSFPSALLLAVGAQPTAVAAADLDGDGAADLVVGNAGSRSVSVVLSDGAGGFLAASEYSTSGFASTGPQQVQVADFDSDGHADLLVQFSAPVAPAFPSPAWLAGAGQGHFSAPTAVVKPRVALLPVLAVGDFNGDQRPDVAVASPEVGVVIDLNLRTLGLADVAAFPQAGTSTTPGTAYDIATADFNEDGRLDLLYTDYQGVELMLGDAATGLRAPVNVVPGAVSAHYFGHALQIGDINGDHRADFVASLKTVTLGFVGDGQGGFQGVWGGPALGAMQLIDTNGDGVLDLLALVRIGISGPPPLWRGDGRGRFLPSPPPLLSVPICDYTQLATGDFDGDGTQDIAIGDPGCFRLVTGRGNGIDFDFQLTDLHSFILGIPVAGDFNADGVSDLAMVPLDQVAMQAWLFRGSRGGLVRSGQFGPPRIPISTTLTNPGLAVVGDFNGDAKQDLLVGEHNFFSVFWGDGHGGFSGSSNFLPRSQRLFSPYDYAKLMLAADVTGDGRLDIVVSTNQAGARPAAILLVPNIGQ